ncbi:hypothetical protein Dimus_005336 [Dionaea muscipula]
MKTRGHNLKETAWRRDKGEGSKVDDMEKKKTARAKARTQLQMEFNADRKKMIKGGSLVIPAKRRLVKRMIWDSFVRSVASLFARIRSRKKKNKKICPES